LSTHVTDQHTTYGTKIIVATKREAGPLRLGSSYLSRTGSAVPLHGVHDVPATVDPLVGDARCEHETVVRDEHVRAAPIGTVMASSSGCRRHGETSADADGVRMVLPRSFRSSVPSAPAVRIGLPPNILNRMRARQSPHPHTSDGHSR
jgi:hypothetical protein